MSTNPKEPKGPKPKKQKKESKKGVMTSQIRKMWNLKKSNYFMFYWYLKLNPQATIIINSNFRNMEETEFFFPNFGCDCVLINKQCIYEMGTYLKTHYDAEMDMCTVYFNPKTLLPLKDRRYAPGDLTETKRRILLQHVLINELNRFGECCNVHFYLKPLRKKYTDKLSTLNIEKMTYQQDDKIIEISGKEFEEYFDMIGTKVNDYFTTFLDKKTNLTRILILGYDYTNSNIREDDKYMQVGSQDFLRFIDNTMYQDNNGPVQIPTMFWNLKAYTKEELKEFLEKGIISEEDYNNAIQSRDEMIRLKQSSNLAQPSFIPPVYGDISTMVVGQMECVQKEGLQQNEQNMEQPGNNEQKKENENLEFNLTPMEEQEIDGFHHTF